jgi:hypothetical protein
MDFLSSPDVSEYVVTSFKRLVVLVEREHADTVRKGLLKSKGFKNLEATCVNPLSESFPARFDAVLVYNTGSDTDEILGNLI